MVGVYLVCGGMGLSLFTSIVLFFHGKFAVLPPFLFALGHPAILFAQLVEGKVLFTDRTTIIEEAVCGGLAFLSVVLPAVMPLVKRKAAKKGSKRTKAEGGVVQLVVYCVAMGLAGFGAAAELAWGDAGIGGIRQLPEIVVALAALIGVGVGMADLARAVAWVYCCSASTSRARQALVTPGRALVASCWIVDAVVLLATAGLVGLSRQLGGRPASPVAPLGVLLGVHVLAAVSVGAGLAGSWAVERRSKALLNHAINSGAAQHGAASKTPSFIAHLRHLGPEERRGAVWSYAASLCHTAWGVGAVLLGIRLSPSTTSTSSSPIPWPAVFVPLWVPALVACAVMLPLATTVASFGPLLAATRLLQRPLALFPVFMGNPLTGSLLVMAYFGAEGHRFTVMEILSPALLLLPALALGLFAGAAGARAHGTAAARFVEAGLLCLSLAATAGLLVGLGVHWVMPLPALVAVLLVLLRVVGGLKRDSTPATAHHHSRTEAQVLAVFDLLAVLASGSALAARGAGKEVPVSGILMPALVVGLGRGAVEVVLALVALLRRSRWILDRVTLDRLEDLPGGEEGLLASTALGMTYSLVGFSAAAGCATLVLNDGKPSGASLLPIMLPLWLISAIHLAQLFVVLCAWSRLSLVETLLRVASRRSMLVTACFGNVFFLAAELLVFFRFQDVLIPAVPAAGALLLMIVALLVKWLSSNLPHGDPRLVRRWARRALIVSGLFFVACMAGISSRQVAAGLDPATRAATTSAPVVLLALISFGCLALVHVYLIFNTWFRASQVKVPVLRKVPPTLVNLALAAVEFFAALHVSGLQGRARLPLAASLAALALLGLAHLLRVLGRLWFSLPIYNKVPGRVSSLDACLLGLGDGRTGVVLNWSIPHHRGAPLTTYVVEISHGYSFDSGNREVMTSVSIPLDEPAPPAAATAAKPQQPDSNNNNSSNNRELVLRDLVPGHFYAFRVLGANRLGEGEPSEPVELTMPPSCPGVPVIAVTAASKASFSVTINPPDPHGSEVLYYHVRHEPLHRDGPNRYRRTGSHAGLDDWDNSNGNSHGKRPGVGGNSRFQPPAASGARRPPALVPLGPVEVVVEATSLPGEPQEVVLSGFDPHCEYLFSVAAENAVGRGLFSAPMASTTKVTAPDPPSAPEVVEVESDSVLVRWWPGEDDAGVEIGSYTVQASLDPSFADVVVSKEVPARLLEARLVGLQPNTVYWIVARAEGRYVNIHSAWSEVSAPVRTEISPPAQVTELQAVPRVTSAEIEWKLPAPNGAPIHTYTFQLARSVRQLLSEGVGVRVYKFVPGGAQNGWSQADWGFYTISDLRPDCDFFFRMRASNAIGDGEWSSVERFSTLEPHQATHFEDTVAVPEYWEEDDLGKTGVYDVTDELGEEMQEVMSATCVPAHIGIGRDSHGLKHRGFKVVKVERIQSSRHWLEYASKKNFVRAKQDVEQPLVVKTDRDWMEIDRDVNEYYFFHGTKPEWVSVIKKHGFEERVASNGLFGHGIYFAENSSKSDEYITPDPQGICYIFLSRVTLGNPFISTNMHKDIKRPPCIKGHFDTEVRGCDHERHDSIVGEVESPQYPNALLKRYREFIVYDRSQCYPEFLVSFKRVNEENPKWEN